MDKNLTEIVYILDRSGSMSGLEADTIGGFNSMIAKQKDTGENAYISTVLFDTVNEVIHDRVPIEKVEEMTEKEYFVRGGTALLDAVGGAIRHIENIHKYARKEDRPAKTVFIITTDGMENSSRYYNYEQVNKMIEKEQKEYGWEFIFIGANIDAAREAEKFGIRRDRALNYVPDEVGTGAVYESISNVTCGAMRAKSSGDIGAFLDRGEWGKVIKKDFEKRAKKRR